MKSALDAKIRGFKHDKRGRTGDGGKALLRLFAYLSSRDPRLNEETVARLGFLAPRRTRAAMRKRRPQHGAPAAQGFARAIVKAAAALTAQRELRRTPSAKVRGAALTGAPPGVWQFIGPLLIPNGQTYGTNKINVIGRVASIAVNPADPQHLLLGAAGGGIWRSLDGGTTWTPCADKMPSLAIGAVAFDPKSPKRVYAGSGEGNFYAALGAGVYGSTNGGATWTVLASTPFVGVGFYDLVVDPKTPNVLYGATTNGFYRSKNGGHSWSLQRPGKCWDLSVDRGGGGVEVLATFVDGLFRSTNGGTSFAPVALPSAPASPWTRLAVDRVANAPDIAYVFGASGTAAYLWRRSGTTWTKIASIPAMSTAQAWYDWYVAASPDNRGQVYLGAIDTLRGDLSGSTWSWTNITTQGANSIHPDQHCLTFSPANSKTIYLGSDGGIFRSTNSGASWKALNKGLGITEIEYLAGNPTTWKWLMAGTQDNGTIRFVGSSTWNQIAQGDGGDCGVNHLSPNIVYHSYYGVSLERSTTAGNTWTSLAPTAMPALFYPPVEVSGSTVGIAGGSLVVTRTGVPPWTSIPLGLAAGELASAMRTVDANTFIIGTTAGRLLRVAWSGASWNKTVLSSPATRYISCVAVDPTNPHRIWVTMSQIGGGLVFRSDNGGSSWVNCTAGLPNIPMNAVTVDPANYQRIWVAADVGVYQSMSLGSSWAAFSNGLPNALAADLLFHKQDRVLVCATRNRGAWMIQVP